MTNVKVCGITNLADAEKALEYGADALGFNFYPPSPRFVMAEKARTIIQELGHNGLKVALFVNATEQRVRDVLGAGAREDGGYDAVQFHGEESREFCAGWRVKVIKAFRIKDRKSIDALREFPADYYLLDSWSAGYGGSGASFPWEWLEGLATVKLILSGGLTADNVGAAIRQVHPYGVDVCSGVESSPGVKDHEKLKEFINAAKSA
jgi:phosphoribosylanthranilate isomerase